MVDLSGRRDAATARAGNGRAVALGAAGWLSLAAAPVFAGMACLAGVSPPGPAEVLCATGPQGLPLTGMAAMYVLMSAFHLGPWLKLIARWRGDAPLE